VKTAKITVRYRANPAKNTTPGTDNRPNILSREPARSSISGNVKLNSAAALSYRKHVDALRRVQHAGCPCNALQHAAVEVRLAAIADPSRERQQKLEARAVGHLRHC
jgi:hypothetical protein